MKKVLNAGCAEDKIKDRFPGWEITGIDIDPVCKPDLLCSVTDIKSKDETFDAIYCRDILEHLFLHEVKQAIKQFFRITKKGGFIVVQSPDVTEICREATNGIFKKAYDAPCGPITYYDMLYGHQPRVEKGDLYMQHKSGLDLAMIAKLLEAEGYKFICGVPGLAFTCTGYKV